MTRDQLPPPTRAEAVALFRLGVVGDLLARDLAPGELRDALISRAAALPAARGDRDAQLPLEDPAKLVLRSEAWWSQEADPEVAGLAPTAPLTAKQLADALERLALERSRIQAAFRKGLYTEDELATELETIERERAPLLNRLELSQMDERHHGARSARLAVADKRLASMRAAAATVDRDQQRAIIGELIERVTVDTETREVEIRVLVGDAPATDDTGAGGDGGAGPVPHSSKGGRRKVSAGSQSCGNGLSPGRVSFCVTEMIPMVSRPRGFKGRIGDEGE